MLHQESRLEGILEAALVMVPTLLGASDTVGEPGQRANTSQKVQWQQQSGFPLWSAVLCTNYQKSADPCGQRLLVCVYVFPLDSHVKYRAWSRLSLLSKSIFLHLKQTMVLREVRYQ